MGIKTRVIINGLFFALIFGTSSVFGTQEPFYLGTYTDHSSSQGIYQGTLDSENGTLSSVTLAAPATDPSFLAWNPKSRFVYAAEETPGTGRVQAFRGRDDGSLVPSPALSAGGNGTCHVSVDLTGRFLLAANYGSGSIACFRLRQDGSLGQQTDLIRFTGSGPNAGRQEGSHAHSVYFSPDDAFVYSCDLGSDQIWIFKFNAATGRFAVNNPPSAKVAPGSGPRHLVFSRDGSFVYVANEMGDSVTVFKRDVRTGNLTALETVTLLPAGASPGKTTAAEIVLHPSGRWLYVSNRGSDTISILAVESSGRLAVLQNVAAGVKSPRSCAIDSTGHWMITAGQEDNRIAMLKIDPRSGELSATAQSAQAASPVCILFGSKP